MRIPSLIANIFNIRQKTIVHSSPSMGGENPNFIKIDDLFNPDLPKIEKLKSEYYAAATGSVDVDHYKKKLGDDYDDHSIICAVIIKRCIRRHMFPSIDHEGNYLRKNDKALFSLLTETAATESWFNLKEQIRNAQNTKPERNDLIGIMAALPVLQGLSQAADTDDLFATVVRSSNIDDDLEDDEGGGKAPSIEDLDDDEPPMPNL